MINYPNKETTKEFIGKVLRSEKNGLYKYPGRYYYYDTITLQWIAVDNSSNNCFIEEFKTKPEAIKWLNSLVAKDVTNERN